MRRLILIRHAKSSWDNPVLSDFERPLNGRGRRSAHIIGDWLRDGAYLPDAAVVSAAERTGETFRRLGFDIPATFTRRLYHASATAMMDALQAQSAANVMMVGHNPGIGDFAERLVVAPPEHPRFFDYPTCATTIIDFDVPDWQAIGWKTGVAHAFVIPRELENG